MSRLLSLIALFSYIFCACIASLSKTQCSWTDDTFGVTFNLYQLQILSGRQISYYSVTDETGNELDNNDVYTYYFNLCAPVLEYPDAICRNPSDGEYYSYCPAQYINASTKTCTLPPEERPAIQNKTYAYQLKLDKSLCYPLSSTESDAFEYSLLDEEGLDPTQGLSVRFKDGAWADIPCGRNRELTLHLKCDDDASSVPNSYEVYEYDHCKYTITVSTIHACPVGCNTFANSLCAGQGLCGYDYTTNQSRCFCYHGFLGSACEQADVLSLLAPIEKKSEHLGTDHVKTFNVTQPMTDPLTGHVVNKVVNVTYDLSMSYNTHGIYVVHDTENGYEYYFNIGGTARVELLPEVCRQVLLPCASATNKSYCESTAIPTSTVGDNGFAYRVSTQTATRNETCILLGLSPFVEYSSSGDDAYNPASGLSVTYSNGSYSAADSSDDQIVNCALTVDLVCPNSRSSFLQTTTIQEVTTVNATVRSVDGACVFSTTFETPLACPYNCITRHDEGYRVCSGRGMCVADPMAGFVRCVCDARYQGDHCETAVVTPSTSDSTTTASTHSHAGFAVALLFLSLLLVAFVGGVVYLYLRNKKLEKYAVPILDEYDQEQSQQIEPRVPDYSDSDSEHFHKRPKIGGVMKNTTSTRQQYNDEMVTVATSLNQTRADKKYHIADDISDEDEEDDDDDEHAPYLAARTNDVDSDDSDEE
eukprot:CAMPEP_0202702010 /NCGR_PEP_ID=MMETSP1385-20130828/15051_1 /ASSEMBLY_ACC=CAM_ASM_000861 /TAXON_ID=933848 /ORGANISM="Elphidium margaritaceum" /LENGTH=702 /DNA_ID=CAMNT_0049359561 /DNA_START=75 /DNA_END=2183 /DNA_ORIENTATION=-